MGIPGILKEIGGGERIALAKLAVEHLEKTQRPLRIAIDAAIWNFQTQAGQGGKNPALRTLYYKLLRLLALPIHPLFVYDGKNKPLIKRGRTVARWGTCTANEASKKLIQHFKFPSHVAPGEAEAECALLQKKGIVDMVMSQDGDAIMFGSQLTLRDWSKEGTRGNKAPTHVNLLDLPRLKERSGLDPDGMILVALLSGGDYDQDGVPGFGSTLACDIARAGFGTDLLDFVRKDDEAGLREWRERLQYELETNDSGYFNKRHKTLKVPDNFPDRVLIGYYMKPAVSNEQELPKLKAQLSKAWDQEIDIPELRSYVGHTFDWLYKPGAWKLVRSMAPPLLAQKLRLGLADQLVTSIEQIRDRREHFVTDGIPELRVTAVPADIVGLDLDAEEDTPEYLARLADEKEHGTAAVNEGDEEAFEADDEPSTSQVPQKHRKTPPWKPHHPEKMWISETIVQLGVPALVEEWQQHQRDVLADPKKFASRKVKPASKVVVRSENNRIEQYFGVTKPGEPVPKVDAQRLASSGREPRVRTALEPTTPTKKLKGARILESSPNIKSFFKSTKSTSEEHSLGALAESRQNGNLSTEHFSLQTNVRPAPVESGFAELSTFSAIVISSPLTSPSTPGKNFVIRSDDQGIELPASVTQRRRRPRNARPRSEQEQLASPGARSDGFESFCRYAESEKVGSSSNAPEPLPLTITELPIEVSTGLQVDFIKKSIYALPRESLPGTWKEIDSNEEVMSVKAKRTARVSYVDLTGE